MFFVAVGEKKLILKGLDLEPAVGESAEHRILDNLKITTEKHLRYRKLPECFQRFLVE
jgi:hypothetical protein